METRSQTRARAGRSPRPPDGVLENPVPRAPSEADEDLGLATLMGDGEAPLWGGAEPWRAPLVGTVMPRQ